MDEMADASWIRAPLSAREAKDLAIAVRAESRRIRDALARRKETGSAIGPPPGGPPPLRGEQSRALLERCRSTREVSRYLAGSARAARHAAGEQVHSVQRRRAAGCLLPAGPDEDRLAALPPASWETGR